MGKGPVSPGATSNMLLTWVMPSGGTCMALPFLVQKRVGLCHAWRAYTASSPPSAGIPLIPPPAPFSSLLLDTPVAASGLLCSEDALRSRKSVGENNYRLDLVVAQAPQDYGLVD